MFIKNKTRIALSFAAIATLITLLTGCMKSDNMTPSVSVSQGGFDTPLSIPTILSPNNITLEAKRSSVMLLKGKTTTNALLYNNSLPVFRANKGDVVNVNFKNSLPEESNIHWHGMLTPALMDGHPKDIAAAGETRNYTFTIGQRAATTWFHPHPEMKTAKQAYMGLAGMFIINDPQEATLNLPSGEREVPLVLGDKRFNADASLNYSPTMMDIMTGYLGDKVLVNNTESPFLSVKTRFYRFRIVNGSNARIYDLALSNGSTFTVIGNDGGLLEKPAVLTHALVSPGERLDILIDFSEMSVGSELFLQSNANTIATHGATTFKVLKFKVATQEAETFTVPQTLSTITPLSISDSKRTRTFTLPSGMGGGMMMSGMHTINGKVYDINRVDETVTGGETEIWVIDNSLGNEPHPMHLHGVEFQVLEKMGGTIEAYERGWKDTILLKKGEKAKIIMRFSTEKGLFLMHCHNLEHEDDGMMMNFEVK
jgi:FtsP/CotA-like multicopper oxidase with cupredoxin domain